MVNMMSIPKVEITSFVEDWADLINLISTKYGSEIGATLMLGGDFIRTMALNTLDDAMTDQYLKESYGDYENSGPKVIQFFSESLSCTMLNFLSAELDLDFDPSTAALLTKIDTRVFYDLAQLIYNTYGETANRHLIRTLDGRTLEITKGWLASDSYLISLVK